MYACVCMCVHVCVCVRVEERNGEVVERSVRSKAFSKMGANPQLAQGRRADMIQERERLPQQD